jgi:DNA-binding transcriptional ArsR family regulator
MDNREKIKKILESGTLAKAKLYQDIINRVARGDRLSATDTKTMAILERELAAEIGDDMEPPELIGSFDDAAVYCGVSKRTISYHLKRGNLRQNADGTFERAVLDAYLQKYGRKKRPNKTERDYEREKLEADIRWRVARANREEMMNEQLLGALISRDDAEREMALSVAEICAGLEFLVDSLPPVLFSKSREEMKQIIADRVWALRDNYYKNGKYAPQELMESVVALHKGFKSGVE